MRFLEDPVYGELMTRLRVGHISQDDLNMLNTRVLSNTVTLLPDKHIPYLVISHVLRESINRMSVYSCANSTNQTVHTFYGTASGKRQGINLSHSLKRAIQLLSEKQTRFMPITLQLYIGMEIMVTHNINLEANVDDIARLEVIAASSF